LQAESAEETKRILFGLLSPRSGSDILEVGSSLFPVFSRFHGHKGHPRGGKWVSRAEGQEAARGSVSRKNRSGGDRTHGRSVRYSSHGEERRTRREEGPRVTTDRPENVQKGKKNHPTKNRALGSPLGR